MNTLESPQLMGLKVTLAGGRVLSVVPVSGQAPEEALEQALTRQGSPPVEKVEEQYYDPSRKERFFYRPWQGDFVYAKEAAAPESEPQLTAL